MTAAGSTYWLVDPLDGTKGFLKGLPEHTVNVALVEAGSPSWESSTSPPQTACTSRPAGSGHVDGMRAARCGSRPRPSRGPGGPWCPARTSRRRPAPC